jgi:hypothetical protein
MKNKKIMIKKNILIAIILCYTLGTYADDTTKKEEPLWKKGGETALTLSQVSLTNWAAGGENSLSLNMFLNYFANYKKGNLIWENKFEFAYGLQKQGAQGLRKSDDKLYLSTTLGKKAKKNWYYTALLSFKSQFTNGYNYPDDVNAISKLFAPAYIVLSIGMEYKPNDFFSLNIAPLAGRLTVVGDKTLSDAGAFGVTPGKKTRSEFGANINLNYRKEIMKNIEFKTKLELFSNYSNHPEYIDVDWEVFLNMKVNKYISANITTHLIYDHDIDILGKNNVLGPKVQFKEIFGVGLTYKF